MDKEWLMFWTSNRLWSTNVSVAESDYIRADVIDMLLVQHCQHELQHLVYICIQDHDK